MLNQQVGSNDGCSILIVKISGKTKQWNHKPETCQFWIYPKKAKEVFFRNNQTCAEKCMNSYCYFFLNACHDMKF